MQSDLGKLFIGGISWDTDEDRLKEYFGQYGEIVEAVIMRDRITGRARGFGFIVFADPVVAERVVMEKHMIDGRSVEAKKAVPRDDQQILSRTSNSVQGSPGLGRTKKIFVGGLASTVTENDFKNYFDNFGNITDVVVMYDHNTQRPRGFGFITYDSEDAVDRVLHKTFHELNGKMVEVKRAVPKELSPGPSRSPLLGYNYGMSRGSNFINSYAQGYNLSTIGGYGRLNPLVTGRSGPPPFGNPGFGMGMEPMINAGYSANSNLSNSQNYARVLGPYYDGNSNRYISPIGYNGGSGRGDSLGSSTTRNLWRNGSFSNSTNPTSPSGLFGSSAGNIGVPFGNSESNWASTPIPQQTGSRGSGFNSRNLGHGFGDVTYGLRSGNYGRSHVTEPTLPPSFSISTGGFDTSYADLYHSGPSYEDSTWRSGSPELDISASFGFGMGNTTANVASNSTEGFIGSYNVRNTQSNRGIAT
ncbi:heterogeneous nuclear ribonucleoprotein 1-like [Silene latifolia]|uniref:heterogeneous nuclear ribonucleoprotein 1-like n=1 Tax=Silene latifolia TaxID=37657 RepID=UPI003D789A6F